MFEKVLLWIKGLFGKKGDNLDENQQFDNSSYTTRYQDTRDINFTAIFSNNIATSTMSDSSALIEAKNKRAELLNSILQDVWKNIKKITASALGTGGCALVPYVNNGKLYFDAVSQDRLYINETNGDAIIDATIIADSTIIDKMKYFRVVNYRIENKTLYVTNKTVTEYGKPTEIEKWKDIEDFAISNVEKVIFGFIKSPIDNRKKIDVYGVPITYGCDKIIADIKICLEQIRKEFELKRVRLQLDDRVFKRDEKTNKPIIEDEVFIAGHSEDGNMFNVFDPAIRESSYHARLNFLFELLEKQIGTSKGVLSTPETRGATATEIKAALGDTFAIITDIRQAIEKGLADFIYACDVLANYYNLTPQGEYEIKYDWSYAMIESTQESWQQKKELQSIGGMSKAELRAWQTGEDIDTAKKKVKEIEKEEPSLKTLVGIE